MSWQNDLKERIDEALPGLVVRRSMGRISVLLPEDFPEEDKALACLNLNTVHIGLQLRRDVKTYLRTPDGIEEAFADMLFGVSDTIHERRKKAHLRALAYGRLVSRMQPTEEG